MHSLAALTTREREVLGLMAEGRSNAGVTTALAVSPGSGGEARGQHLRQALAVLRYLGTAPD
jgi:FixJ family two-component response regulator